MNDAPPLPMVRLPMGDGGVPAIEAEPEAWAVIEHAAISAMAAHPMTREPVLSPETRLAQRAQAKAAA